MKNSLKYLSLLSVVGLGTAAAAETAGFAVSSFWNYQLPFIVFISSSLLMTFATDYRPSKLRLREPRLAKPILLPAEEGFIARRLALPPSPRLRRVVRHQLIRS